MSSTSSPVPVNRLITYLRMLQRSKPGLPHGQLVCVSASHTITTTEALLQLASAVGSQIAILQIQADIIDDWSDETVNQLMVLAKTYGFLLWEGGRILNPYLSSLGKRESESIGQRKEIIECIRRSYTKGRLNMASWAGLATAWASGVMAEKQETDMLIPTLKNAARETVSVIAQTITTEITAEGTKGDHQTQDDHQLPDSFVDQDESGDGGLTPSYAITKDLGDVMPLPPRKASTISLTQTITQHTETSLSSPSIIERRDSVEDVLLQFTITGDDIPPPPLLVRGLVLCLPSLRLSIFTPEYRRSCLAAARANRDFVIGFVSKEPWTVISRTDDILDVHEVSASEAHSSREEAGGRDSDVVPDWFIVFSPITEIAANSSSHEESDAREHRSSNQRGNGTEEVDCLASGTLPESGPATQSSQASRLSAIVQQAMAVRDETSKKEAGTARQSGRKPNRTNILYIPIVKLGL
ncbi:hypothetical protein DTO166G4_6946 [Paecilomyces variotii]|uniref:Uncharacterized protein n=1 Tax=Byssochlamys spectabilis TaxID=264951 RepID=A0A443HY89_BYSSP|nr:hypothetical protein C8Q69DRAFT_443226 [Paecilomyces variotii]KAJ9211432.1 hypothetical protein DTO166G4_6946 [Paecilomyces variotii]KAJ9231239.1 hypothetical protein DTO166G5_6861 [Paecilomyces variotii]KAJ9248033.1 hypothetical protein DTO207G8_7696 [Paecilomyces variotii]KAJ9290647.1 hypothetical protein DTO021C3_1912 [Paecilomyces variotii]KAJ9307150.1 hypothetical protein DTO217A2_3388 [Paecilomyces variotii]